MNANRDRKNGNIALYNDIERILLTEEVIAARVKELALTISADFQEKNPLFVGVLKGSFIFMADLVRKMTKPCELDFMAISSYGKAAATTGTVRILKDLDGPIANRDVIIVEDILDSGATLSYIINLMGTRNPASISICTLLDKPERRRIPLVPRYDGFQIPDEFVVGYGLDYAGRFRNLPYIGVLKRSVYE
jgi:hypoxanthine phosphoribosyltransferase